MVCSMVGRRPQVGLVRCGLPIQRYQSQGGVCGAASADDSQAAGTGPDPVLYSVDMADEELSGHDVVPPVRRGLQRVSHDDREQVVEVLQAAAGDGRLTADELDARLEQALSARTFDDLAVLVADLPAAGTALTPVAVSAVMPSRELVTIESSGSSTQRKGRWTVPERMRLDVTNGQVDLDFTEALITRPVLYIDARLHTSQLTLITRPGIAVDADDVSVHGGQVKVREPKDAEVPVFFRVVITGTCDGGVIITRPPRRSFGAGRRAPRR